eukprot:TRINITY_DN16353_c0_g1_i1.p1 TRINITY_DN16353_c0_g1~~TRINITY_DN16353_c0_g1_i1.p1  ORF type:complete len:214 (+),score=24.75 TRINITY_DN16353_c0_g1_i1:337-978(+)
MLGCKGLSIACLQQPLTANRTLRSLCLSGNRIHNPQIAHLTPMLASRFCPLLSLSLSGNLIGDDGAMQLFQEISKGSGLIKLDLSVNNITARGLVGFRLDDSCSLEFLSLSDNSLGDEGVRLIAKRLSEQQSWLRCLHLSANGTLGWDTVSMLRAVEEVRGFGWRRERQLWIAHLHNPGHLFEGLSHHVMHLVIKFAERSIRITCDERIRIDE